MKNEVIKANTGKVTHLGIHHAGKKIDGTTHISYYTPCGSFSNSNTTKEMVTGLEVNDENVTCKKCKKVLAEVKQAGSILKIKSEPAKAADKKREALEAMKQFDGEIFFVSKEVR